MVINSTIKPAKLIITAISGILVIGIYFYSFTWLITNDWSRGDFTYCYIIPFIVLYLLWEKRRSLSQTEPHPSWAGVMVIVIGLFLFWLGELGGEYYSLYLSSWSVLTGLCLMHLGWNKFKIIAFPMFFIITMFPPPNFIYGRLSLNLKLISSQLGVAMMQVLGMSAFREGNIIDLGFTQLQVVDACSGLRYLIPLIVLGILLAYFFKAALWKKAVLVISTIPISIFVNSLRIAAVGVLYPIWGPKVAEGFFHDFSGWFIFMAALALLVIEMLALNGFGSLGSFKALKGRSQKSEVRGQRTEVRGRGERSRTKEDEREEMDESPMPSVVTHLSEVYPPLEGVILPPSVSNKPNPNHEGGWLKALLSPPQFVVAVILLSATLALSHGVEFREKIPMNKSFDGFPVRVGEWDGIRQSMEQKFIDTLDLSDYVIIDYQNNQEKNVNFYVAYYQSQRKGESIHSPATCLPGGGWIFKQAGGVSIPLKEHNPGTMKVNRAFMQKNDFRQLTYYWFPARGRILTNAYELKLYTFWDALTRQRTDGALVRVVTPVYEDEKLEDAEKRLQEFVGVICPVLSEYLPE